MTESYPRKNVAIVGNSIVLAYPRSVRKGCQVYERGAILVMFNRTLGSVFKGKALTFRAESHRRKLY